MSSLVTEYFLNNVEKLILKHAQGLVVQLCLTLWYPLNCSPPGSYVHEIFQARILEWVAISFSRDRIFPTQGSNLCLLHCRGFFTCYAIRGAHNLREPDEKGLFAVATEHSSFRFSHTHTQENY